jgi:quercetin dioxygenase-like cupin family protein
MTTLAAPSVNHVSADDLPWADTGIGVGLKVMRVSIDTGVWVLMNRFEPGARIPRHKHTGPVEGYTLTGRWHYLEYDFWSTAGSYIYEPANSVHTLDVPADNTGPTDVLFVIEGALLNLDDSDQVESVSDGPSILESYYLLLDAQGTPRPDGILS